MRHGRDDRPEYFETDSLEWDERGILINEQHNRQAPIVRAVPFVEGSEVKIRQSLPNTTRGRDAAVNLREGVFTGLSVEFKTIRHAVKRGMRAIAKARLVGAGLVDSPSYSGATVEVRESGLHLPPSEITLWL